MKPVTVKTEKEISPMEILKSIRWVSVDCDSWCCWFKSEYGITPMQIKVLELLLTKSLNSKFKLGDNELFYHGGQVSFTIMENDDHVFWDTFKGEFSKFVENPELFFDLNNKTVN